MKKQSKDRKLSDYYTAYKAIKNNTPPKRIGARDGSIPTHPMVECPDLSEAKVLEQCIKWLKYRGILCNRNNVGAGVIGESGFHSYGIKSAGDIVGLTYRGTHFEIEVKRGKGGRLSLEQQKRMKDIQNNNGLYFVIHGLPELIHYMGEYIDG